MRILLLTLLFLGLVVWLPSSADSHGGPPFIKVNGVANQVNQAGASSPFFKIPNEIAAKPIQADQSATFEIDTTLVPFDPNLVSDKGFTWDFGDSGLSTGLKTNHTYKKAGSFVVVLKVKDPNYTELVELETFQVNVVPSQGYQLPKAVIKVNGKTITNPFEEPISVTKDASISFDGSGSSGEITAYKWDFGDGADLATGVKQKHEYNFTSDYSYSFFPVLRVEDKNGLYSDAVVQISYDPSIANKGVSDGVKATASASLSKYLPIGLGVLVTILIVGVLIFLVFKRRK